MGLVCGQLAQSGLDDREDIFVLLLIIIMESEVSTFLIVVIFCFLCVWGDDTLLFSLYMDPRKVGVVCSLLLWSPWCVKIKWYVTALPMIFYALYKA